MKYIACNGLMVVLYDPTLRGPYSGQISQISCIVSYQFDLHKLTQEQSIQYNDQGFDFPEGMGFLDFSVTFPA